MGCYRSERVQSFKTLQRSTTPPKSDQHHLTPTAATAEGNVAYGAAGSRAAHEGLGQRDRELRYCKARGKSRQGSFQLRRKTRRDRMRVKLKDIKAELRRRIHQPLPSQGQWLKQVVTGHFAYYAVPTNSRALSAFRHYVTGLWRRVLRRRSQKDGFTWERMTKLADDWLSQPHILHPWPDVRFDVKHPR